MNNLTNELVELAKEKLGWSEDTPELKALRDVSPNLALTSMADVNTVVDVIAMFGKKVINLNNAEATSTFINNIVASKAVVVLN